MSSKVLKINDAGWLYAETYRTPMQVGVLATFAMPEDAGPSYMEDLVTRWRQVRTFQPPFNYRLKGTLPRWETLDDDEIDLDYHFRHSAVPSPGGQRELGVLVSRLHSTRMDRRYPLWECHIIEGVSEGHWSMYMKMHHSQIDGVGGIRLANRMFSVDPDARGMLPPWAVGTVGPDQSGQPPKVKKEVEVAPSGKRHAIRSAASVVTSLATTYRESAIGSGDALRAVAWKAPKSVFNGRISTPRRFATQTYSVERLKAVAKAADGSLNDVFLAVIGGALRRYLTEIDALPKESLTANVPVSVRDEGVGVGNAITFLYAKLGTDVEDPLERVKVIHDSTQRGKSRVPKVSGPLMDGYTALLMGPFLGQAMLGVGGHGRPASNLVISNVPGMREERYFDGSKVEEYFPLSLLFHGQALNITAVSNADSFCIGYTGCRDAVPSLQKIAVYTGEALEELEAAVGIA